MPRKTGWKIRDELRLSFESGEILRGTFVKLPMPEVLEISAEHLDFVVLDLEHSAISRQQAISLITYGRALGFPVLVRVPTPDMDCINTVLEAGAAGIQLSTLDSIAKRDAFIAACRYAPSGQRSISLSHPSADYGRIGLQDYLDLESGSPPILIGQIETSVSDELSEVLRGLDVAFVGTTDLSVSHGLTQNPQKLQGLIDEIALSANKAHVALGGWASSPEALKTFQLHEASWQIIGSDIQQLAAGMASLHN